MGKPRRKAKSRPEVFRHGERTNDGRRIIVVGGRAEERDALPKPDKRCDQIDIMQSRGMFSRDRARNDILAEVARIIAKHWFAAGLAHSPKSPNLMATGAGTGDAAYMTPTQEHAAYARDLIRMARGMIGPRNWPAIEAVVCEDVALLDYGQGATGRSERSAAIAAISISPLIAPPCSSTKRRTSARPSRRGRTRGGAARPRAPCPATCVRARRARRPAARRHRDRCATAGRHAAPARHSTGALSGWGDHRLRLIERIRNGTNERATAHEGDQ